MGIARCRSDINNMIEPITHSFGNYLFKCACFKCADITKHFNLKSEEEAIKLGYQASVEIF